MDVPIAVQEAAERAQARRKVHLHAERMLRFIRSDFNSYFDDCELIGGFKNPLWLELTTGSGEIKVGNTDYVRLAFFDMDYEEAVFVQSWNHDDPAPTWNYLLMFNTGRNDWFPEVIDAWWNEGGTGRPGYRPSFGVVGQSLDLYSCSVIVTEMDDR